MTSPTDHRGAFRAAIADGRECDCKPGSCLYPCPLCTADFIQDHPCPAMYPTIYYIGGDTPAMLSGDQSTVLTWVAIRYGQCGCEASKCLPECAACASGSFRCPGGRHVKLRAHEKALYQGYQSGELPCPYSGVGAGGQCTVVKGRWYHGDCVPRDARMDGQLSELATSLLAGGINAAELAMRTKQYRQGLTFVCQQHDRHPHDGLTCAQCPACLALDPNAVNAAHDMSKWIGSDAEVALAQHRDRLAEALGIVGAEDDVDMYEAVEGLHKEVDRMREVFGRVSYLLQVALNPNASSAAYASPAEQPWNGAQKALEIVQEEVNNVAGKGKSDVVG